MHRTDKYSRQSTILWPVWLNGSVFVYELSGCEFKSRCCHYDSPRCFWKSRLGDNLTSPSQATTPPAQVELG